MHVNLFFCVCNPLLNGSLFQSNTSKWRAKVLSVNTKIVRHCHGGPYPVLSFPQEEVPPYRWTLIDLNIVLIWRHTWFICLQCMCYHLHLPLLRSTLAVVVLSIPSNKTSSC
jgi:hypothetical protein